MAEGTESTPNEEGSGPSQPSGPEIDLSDAERVYIVLSLCENDDFRKRITEDPVSALKELGIEVNPKALPKEITLPEKAECLANLKKFIRAPSENRAAFVIRWPFICG